MTLLWLPPSPEASHRAGVDPLPPPAAPRSEPPLWSMRRTALAILAAAVAGVLTVFGASYADTGSSGTGSGSRTGGFGGRNLPGGGLPGGFGQAGQLPGSQSGTGQSGTGQSGTGQPGLGQSGFGQPGVGQPQPAPTASN